MTDGERWARELLAELRRDGYRPGGWARFLARSLERARERRRERPRARLEALLLGAAVLSAWAAVALAGRPQLAAAGVAWWALVALMADWHLGMLERPDGRPLDRLGVPNVLCLLRLAAVPALAVLPPVPLGVALLAAGAADVLDGRLARARDEVTQLGFWLDGVADGLVLGTVAAAGARAGLLPWWAAALALARHTLPWALIASVYFVRAAPPAMHRSVSGRVSGLVLFAGLVLALAGTPAGTPLVAAGALAGVATLASVGARSVERSAVRPLSEGESN